MGETEVIEFDGTSSGGAFQYIQILTFLTFCLHIASTPSLRLFKQFPSLCAEFRLKDFASTLHLSSWEP